MKFKFCIILLLPILVCCQDSFELPDVGRKIVINGLITNDSLFNVRIGTSTHLLNNDEVTNEQQMDLLNADVNIFQNGKFIDSLFHKSLYGNTTNSYDWNDVFFWGNYRSGKLIAKEGTEYLIKVNAHGFAEATAYTRIPKVVEIESIDTTQVIVPLGEYISLNTGLSCKIRFIDPADNVNYYFLTVGKVPAYKYDNSIEIDSKDPVIEEILHTRDRGVEGIAFSDKVINGQAYTLSIIIRDESISWIQTAWWHQGDISLSFRLYSIPEDYFRYIRSLNQYNRNFGNPLADPVMIFSNVIGGFGMFAGAAVSSVSIKYPDR
jgi:hypothetical protein